MAKRNRKNVKSTESINELSNEAATVLGDSYGPRPETTEQPIETSQDAPETVEEPSEDTGTEEQVTEPEVAPEDVEESDLNEQVEEEGQTSTEEPKEEEKVEEQQPAVAGRRAAVKDDSLLKVLFTENPQRAGTKSHGYNETLMAEGNLTVKKAMELGVPRHHLLYLKKEGKLDVVTE